jgi:hypothetical protein
MGLQIGLSSAVSDTLAEEFIEQNLQTKFRPTCATESEETTPGLRKIEKSEQELVKYAAKTTSSISGDR